MSDALNDGRRLMGKYGKVSDRAQKYMKHVPLFDIHDRVRVTIPGPFEGQAGTVRVRNKVGKGFIYGVDFGAGGRELYYQQNELERTES